MVAPECTGFYSCTMRPINGASKAILHKTLAQRSPREGFGTLVDPIKQKRTKDTLQMK